jgi:serine/threonine-protein kinase
MGWLSRSMTRAGDVLGTPAYIAPEQVLGQELSPATDVYGLATMLYQLLAGVFPFSHDGPAVALLFKHAHEAPKPLRDVAPHVPEEVAAVVMRGLATDPAQRFQTAESFGAALAQAGTKAWHAGWLWAEQVPILDAEPIVNAAGYPSAPRSAVAPPTIAPGFMTREETHGTWSAGAFSSGNDQPADPAAQTAPARASLMAANAQESAAPEARDSAASRRRIVVAAVVVIVIVIAIIAILVLPGLFKVYRS